MSGYRPVVWRGVDPALGVTEYLVLGETTARGVILAQDPERGPFQLDYRLQWDLTWWVQTAHFSVHVGSQTRTLDLTSPEAGVWELPGVGPVECDGIDLWPSSFTNTFPIRRLQLQQGESRELRMLLVDAPSLNASLVPQTYTRIAPSFYRFQSKDFQADLEVDEEGLVVNYPGLFLMDA